MAARLNKGLITIGVLLLTFLFVSAGRFGVAELLGLSATQEMNRWTQAQRVPTAEELLSVATRIEWAIRLADLNPSYHESLARVALLRAAQSGLLAELRSHSLEVARAQIHRAIALRPVSPYSWTILLLVKRDLHEYDEEFRQALHRAVELGPWEPELLPQLADVGLSAWVYLPEKEQSLVSQVFIRGLQRQQSAMLAITNAHRGDCANQQVGCK
jgi:hypothetical protein